MSLSSTGARVGTFEVPEFIEFPSKEASYDAFKTCHSAIEKFGNMLSYDPEQYPVIVEGQRFVLVKTSSSYVVQKIGDWRRSLRTGFCVSRNGQSLVCDERRETIEAVRKFAHGIIFLARSERWSVPF